MSLMGLAVVAAAGVKAVVFLVYLFLYLQYRERFLGFWTLAWGLILLKSALDPFAMNDGQTFPFFAVFQIILNASVLCFAWGAWNFVGRALPVYWLYSAAAASLITMACVLFQWPKYLSIVPTIFMFGLIHIQTGIVLLRNLDAEGLGVKITAAAFILNGLHQFDFPLFRTTELAPFGYLLDAFLRLIIGIGFLLTYFEKIRCDLSRQEEQFRLLAENARDIIFRQRLKPTPCVEYISPAVERFTGYSPEEYYANPGLLFHIFHPDDRPLIWRPDGTVAPRDNPLAFRVITRDNRLLWAECHFTLLRDHTGEVETAEGIIRDITARKELEQELFRLDRFNIVGQMAACLGHEIRNPLTTVRGYLQILSRKPDLAPYRDRLGLLLGELDQANALISEYLSLSKNRLANRQTHNLSIIVERLIPHIETDAASLGRNVRFVLNTTPDLKLDEREICQLVLKLSRNGFEAMPPGKTLTIKTLQTKNNVVLAVQDEGQEIPAPVLEQMGVPFFTTKETGTGLGLAICYSIANRHLGKIDIRTGPGGTTFLVSFPLMTA